MTPDEEHADLSAKLAEAERRLDAIGEAAAGEIAGTTADEKLADAERRLDRIHRLVTLENP